VTRPTTLFEARDRFTRVYLLRTIERNEWNLTRAAAELGIDRPYLYALIRKYEIRRPE
jgi:two-component system nitrogen regulation response regulator NtrX